MTGVRSRRYIGGYRVIAPVGAGGFATVYRAIDEENGREVAIKVLAENHSLVAETRRRFLAEIDLLRTVDSQAIAQVYEVGTTESGQPYMVLELANRGDLRRRVEEIRSSHQTLKRAELALLAHHLYEALTTLHRAEIVHRDVSPGNILIRSHQGATTGITRTGDGSVALLEPGERFLLADLGHAKDMIRASGFTAGGGTMGFTSPEQRDDITVVDLRADIFSATAVIEWAVHDGPFGDDLEPFFAVGLAEDPDDRFSSMTEWHGAFSAALSASGNEQHSSFLPFSPKAVAETTKRRTRTVAFRFAALVAAAVVVGGVAALLVSGLEGETNRTVGQTGLPGATAEAPGNIQIQSNELLKVDSANISDDPSSTVTTQGVLEIPDTTTENTDSSDSTESTGSSTEESSNSLTSTTQAATTASTEATTTTQASTSTTNSESDPTSTTGDSNGSEPPTTVAAISSVGPSADIDGEPNSESSATVDLRISGTASAPIALEQIDLMVWNTKIGEFWAVEIEEFEPGRRQFAVAVEPDGDDTLTGTWEYTIPAEQLEPGLHFIRVWATGPDSQGSDTHSVLIGP